MEISSQVSVSTDEGWYKRNKTHALMPTRAEAANTNRNDMKIFKKVVVRDPE